MAARKEPPSRDAMLTKRVASLKSELGALNKAGKSGSKTFHSKMNRLHKYEKMLKPKKAFKPVDYSKGNKAPEASVGTRSVAALVKAKGPLRQVLAAAKKGGRRAKEAAARGSGKKGGVSREAYEEHIRPRK